MDTLASSLSSRRSRLLAASVTLLLVVVTALAVPHVRDKLSDNPVFFTIFLTLAWAADALTAFLFLMQARIGRATPFLLLASGYAFSSLAIAVHALVFPGVFAPKGLLGADSQSAVWFWVWWHAGFPLIIVAYATVQKVQERRAREGPASDRAVLLAISSVLAIVASLALLTLKGDRMLPVLIHKGQFALLITSGVGPAVMLSILVAIVVLARTTRLRRTTDLWLTVALCASFLDCALTLLGAQRYTVGWYLARTESLIAATVVLVTFLRTIDVVLGRLAILSRMDGLTALANRRALDEQLDLMVHGCARAEKPLSFLMIDVDQFKRYNDRYGHLGGDETLRIVADCISRSLSRRSDFCARFGGEEFAVLLPSTDLEGACMVAERIREIVQRCAIEHADSPYGTVTISVGVASLSSDLLRRENASGMLVARADEALYRAKADGRNRVDRHVAAGAVTIATLDAPSPTDLEPVRV